MPWFRVDDNLASHPKVRTAGLPAMGLWVVCGAYASQYLTEGFVPEWFVVSWPQGKKLARELVAANLWFVSPGGWTFHQWDQRQLTKEHIEEERAASRERQRKWREKNRNKRVSDDVTNDVMNGVTDAVTSPAPSLPTPSQPLKADLIKGGQRTETLDPSEARCTAHQGVADPGPCRGCMTARESAERALERVKLAVVDERRDCRMCDEDGFVLDESDGRPIARCDHQQRRTG
jgi:hypothetical protein